MGASVSAQSLMFLQSALLGLILGAAYDFLGAVRYRFGRQFVTVSTDIVFSGLFFLSMAWFVMGPGEGKLRLFALLGMFLGAVIYFLTVSRYFNRVFCFAVVWIIKILGFLLLPLKGMVFFVEKSC